MRRAVFVDEELVLAEANGVDAGEPLDPAGRGLGLLGRGQDEADGGDEQDGGEDVADPLEALEEAEAGGDEGSAHDDGAAGLPRRGPWAGGSGSMLKTRKRIRKTKRLSIESDSSMA